MRLGLGLQMQQTQRMIMTPELRQAIAVLQLPVAELADFIDKELLENPCLEVESKEEPEESPADSFAKRLLEYLGPVEGGSRASDAEEELGFEAYTPTVVTLHEHLLTQLSMAPVDGKGRRIGEFLIGNLDDYGYLTISTTEAAKGLDVTPEQAEAVLQLIQGFDPVGVGARSLKECLLLQWASLDCVNPLVPILIERYLDDIGEARITRIANELCVTPVTVQEAIDLIRTLDPKPGRCFGRTHETRYVVPDVAVERVGRDYVVVVNDSPVPRLLVSGQYRKMLSGELDAEARRYVEQKINSALWLVKSIEQRRSTLQKVTETILRFQRDFFDHGHRYLRPLTLRDVAEVVGVHESTVSRATSGKYVQTPRGTFELKFFFSSGVDGDSGDGLAAESVKRLIADLIEKEDTADPLSDQSLTDRLQQQGVRISRRTVAKYREEMRVPSSGKRKRYK